MRFDKIRHLTLKELEEFKIFVNAFENKTVKRSAYRYNFGHSLSNAGKENHWSNILLKKRFRNPGILPT